MLLVPKEIVPLFPVARDRVCAADFESKLHIVIAGGVRNDVIPGKITFHPSLPAGWSRGCDGGALDV